LLNTADDHSAVRIPYLLSDHTNRKGPLYSQTASEEIRTIIQFAHRCQNPILCVFRERTRCGRVVKYSRDRSGREPQMLRHGFQCYPGLFRIISIPSFHKGVSSRPVEEKTTQFTTAGSDGELQSRGI